MRKYKTVLCREGLYYLLVLAFVTTGALLRDINLLMVVAGMLLGPLLYNWRSVIVSLRGLNVERKAPKVICAGDVLVVDLAVACSRKRGTSFAVVAEDRVRCVEGSARGQGSKAEVLLARIRAGETCRQSYQGRLLDRGRYEFSRLSLSTRFPLGLVRHAVIFDKSDSLLVYPRLGRLAAGWKRLERDAFQGSQQDARRQQGAVEGDFFGLRDWRPGDSRHWIHWRTSARRGTLAVRQFEQPRNEDLVLILELWKPASPRAEHLARIETAVSFAATIASDLCRRGNSRLWLALAAKEPRVLQGPASALLATEIMEQLAVADGDSQDRLPDLLGRGLNEMPAGTRAVVVSTRPVDLGDWERFGPMEEALRGRLSARRLLAIDASSPELADYYRER